MIKSILVFIVFPFPGGSQSLNGGLKRKPGARQYGQIFFAEKLSVPRGTESSHFAFFDQPQSGGQFRFGRNRGFIAL